MRKFNENYSLVRFLYAVPDGPIIDIYIDDNVYLRQLHFREFTPYIYLPEGEYKISIFENNTTENPLLEQNIEIMSDELMTIAITGRIDDMELLMVNEDKNGTDYNTSKLRVVDLASDIANMNILLNEETLFEDVKYGETTDYVELPPDTYRIDVENILNEQLIRTTRVRVSPNKIYTLYILGLLPNTQIYQSLDGSTYIRNKNKNIL